MTKLLKAVYQTAVILFDVCINTICCFMKLQYCHRHNVNVIANKNREQLINLHFFGTYQVFFPTYWNNIEQNITLPIDLVKDVKHV